MNRIRAVSTSLVFLALATVVIAWWSRPAARIARDLSSCSSQAVGSLVNFAEIAPFEWERMFVFSPYTSHEQIERSLGFPWSGVESTSIDLNDSVNLIVFSRDHSVVCWLEHFRGEGDFESLDRMDGYPKNEAVFELYADPSGWITFMKSNRRVAEQSVQPELPITLD